MSLLRELVVDYQEDVIDLSQALREATALFATGERGGPIKSSVKGSSAFTQRNKKVPRTVTSAVAAMDTYAVYKKTKKFTTRLYARDEYEKRMFREIVSMLTKSGKYRVRRSKVTGGSQHFWELERKGSI